MKVMPIRALLLLGLAGACTAPEHSVHEGDSGYYYNYVPVPSAPTLDSLVPGDRKIVVHFTPSAAQYYIATCSGGKNGNTFKSPATVDSLQNGVEYSCSVTAFNSSRPSKPSAELKATPRAAAP
jgi:hypothetical protein